MIEPTLFTIGDDESIEADLNVIDDGVDLTIKTIKCEDDGTEVREEAYLHLDNYTMYLFAVFLLAHIDVRDTRGPG